MVKNDRSVCDKPRIEEWGQLLGVPVRSKQKMFCSVTEYQHRDEHSSVEFRMRNGKRVFDDVRYIYPTFWVNGLKIGLKVLSGMVILKVTSATKLSFTKK